MGDGVAQPWAEFLHMVCAFGREETLFAPDFASDSGQGVRKGWLLLVIPGGAGCGLTGPGRLMRRMLVAVRWPGASIAPTSNTAA